MNKIEAINKEFDIKPEDIDPEEPVCESGMGACVGCGKPTRSHVVEGKKYCHTCYLKRGDEE